MAGRRLATWGGVAAIGGGAYYLYSAGGDPKLAEKKLEHDLATASAKVKGDLPGREKEAKKAGEEGFEAVRAKAQNLTDDAKAEAQKAGQKFDEYSYDTKKKLEGMKQQTSKEINAAANKFDKEVSDKINQSKGWFGGWFGGK